MSLAAGKGKKRGKGEDVEGSLEQLPEQVRARLRRIVQCIVPNFDISELEVHCMGSRWYGLQGPDSDLDLYATVPGEVYINIQLRSSLIGALNLEHLCGAVNASFVGCYWRYCSNG